MSETRFFGLRIEEVLRRLAEYARDAERRGAKAVVLIGSLARGDYTAFSDADIVIIVEHDHRRPIDRIAEYIDPTLPVDLEPRVYTVNELRAMARQGARLVNEIIGGVLLAGDGQVVEELKGLYAAAPQERP